MANAARSAIVCAMRHWPSFVIASALVLGCSDGPTRVPPSVTPQADAGDAGEVIDSGSPPADAGLVADAGMAPPANIERLDLGTVTLDAMGMSGEVKFTLPSTVSAFSIIIDGPTDVTTIVATLDGPTGNLVSDDDSMVSQLERLFLGPFAAQFKGPNRVIQDEGRSAAMFPNNPNVTVAAGEYTMKVVGVKLDQQGMGTAWAGDVAVWVLYRERSAAAGRVNVNLYFTGAGNIDAASAPTSMLIAPALDSLRTIYAQANITIGDVSYYDIDPSFSTIENFNGPNSELADMFELTAGKSAGLHYFFVDRFEGGFGGGVGGIAGGLPGPALSPGTVNSGVAVAMSAANGDPAVLAHVMGHEGGHWLGLFHTSEFTGTEDQLPDTPAGQAGSTHLMYPAVGGGQMISPSQAKVMRDHMEIVQ